MGSLVWRAGPGNWNSATNWTVLSGSDPVPSASDTATIADASLNYVVTVSDAEAAQSLLLASATAKLNVTGTLTIGGSVTQNAAGSVLTVPGTLALGGSFVGQAGTLVLPAGGALEGGTFAITGGSIAFTGGTLDGVTWQGTLLANGNTLNIKDGVTLQGVGATGTGDLAVSPVDQGSTINFLNSASIDNATIHLAVLDGANGYLSVGSVATLTLGSHSTLLAADDIRSQVAILGSGTVVNYGTMTASGELDVSPAFDNEGVVSVPQAGSVIYFLSDLTNNGAGLSIAGEIGITGSLLGTGTVSLSGELMVGGTIQSGSVIDGSGGAFALVVPTLDPSITIAGFAGSSSITLTSIVDDGNINPYWSGTPAGGILTIKDGATTVASLFLTGISNTATFSVKTSGVGYPGTEIDTTNVACFSQGTAIATPTGETCVEDLKPGDLVAVASGAVRPVVWLGHRTVRCAEHRSAEDVWPIRVVAGAIRDGVPHRDLWLSPEHAVFLDGHLIPIRLLANDITIRQEPRSSVTYWHVELDAHDIVLAEAMPAESYLDTGNRSDFANGGAVVTLQPDFARVAWAEKACAPQLRAGRLLERIRAGLWRRAEAAVEPALRHYGAG